MKAVHKCDTESGKGKKILWLSPSFNHYKSRFLDQLAREKEICLTVLSGAGREGMGDLELDRDWAYDYQKIDVTKSNFGNSAVVRSKLRSMFKKFDWVLIPAEKKNTALLFYAVFLRVFHPKTKLFSYCHPTTISRNGRVTFLDNLVTNTYFKLLDRTVFYTQDSCEWAVNNKKISRVKAYWANNTIDTNEVAQSYSFHFPPENRRGIVFIGRIIPSKRIDLLLIYYHELRKSFPELTLDVIGDGPESHILEKAARKCDKIRLHGSIIDEKRIAPLMSNATMVFVPGLSGLSVNHAFAYGRAYFTLNVVKHAPEIGYLENGVEGYQLAGDFESNIGVLKDFLSDREKIRSFSMNAFKKSETLSVDAWVKQIKRCFQ
ncbi:glycosyltransferase [Halioglobus maricola]|uniref:Glycosyltransferase n=1 Tax=Halioglobus maricola TaxID=2601894 RepID=A0A5P9NFM9_9GAMM|nr:glycosyltransferase family 4 protein [Halioglobus maricola]QFU74613.1 glycosyltransferase [Halioglobus maricola]